MKNYLYNIAMFDGCLHKQQYVASESYEFALGSNRPFGAGDQQQGGSRLLFEYEAIDSRMLKITNLGDQPIQIEGTCLRPGENVDASFPFQIHWQDCWLQVFQPIDEQTLLRGCGESSKEHRSFTSIASTKNESSVSCVPLNSINRSPAPDTLICWFNTLSSIHRHTVSTNEFHEHAIRAIVEPGGLDAGLLLERDGEDWNIRCSHMAKAPIGIAFEPSFADLVCRRRETLLFEPNVAGSPSANGKPVAILASPIFNEEMEIVAVLYGVRQTHENNRRQQIRELEALWIRLLADTIATGYDRVDHKSQVARQDLLLQQAFPPDIIKQLSLRTEPELLSEDREVTLMFADLVDSSSICENESPQVVIDFLSDVMDVMTAIVHRHDGVIVDFYGDGIIAMWNAPVDQPDHARRACQAALEILRQETAINGRWAYQLGRSCRFGLGIHTGNAIVGNSGSRFRLKYGPRGIAVNLANRIEKATRTLRQSILISDETQKQLPCHASTYRLGQFKLWGIDKPVALHALYSLEDHDAVNSCCVEKHREFMQMVEGGDYRRAAEHLDSCTGCVLDELSFGVLQKQLESMTLDEASSTNTEETVFDLTQDL